MLLASGSGIQNRTLKFCATGNGKASSLHWSLDRIQAGGLPMDSLGRGRWVKLICGASFEDVTEVRNLSLVYALAGVDCIDCAADQAVVTAVSEGVNAALNIATELGYRIRKPWIMVSISDDEDPHFRKAEFNAELCPSDCSRPCERVCPASAIHFDGPLHGGVVAERCYGCGRCVPVCPVQNIEAKSFRRSLETVARLLYGEEVDAVEIHTGAGHIQAFELLLEQLAGALKHVQLVAVSCPDLGDSMISSMTSMYKSIKQHITCPNLWQLDGRPMSGDIGKGATKAAVNLMLRVAESADRPPGYLQLAGGTNFHTVEALKNTGLLNAYQVGSNSTVAGIAYGGYARKIVSRIFRSVPTSNRAFSIEDSPELLLEAVSEAGKLVWPVKCAQ